MRRIDRGYSYLHDTMSRGASFGYADGHVQRGETRTGCGDGYGAGRLEFRENAGPGYDAQVGPMIDAFFRGYAK